MLKIDTDRVQKKGMTMWPGHWGLSGKCGFDWNDKWYNHVPESVLENENYKLLWDFSIRADRHIEARRLDLKCHYDQNLDIHFFTISYTIGLS